MKIESDTFLKHFVEQQKQLASSIDYILRMHRGRKLISVKALEEIRDLANSIVENQKETT